MKTHRSLFALTTLALATLAVYPLAYAGTPLDDLAAAKKLDARNSINELRVASAVVDTETVTIDGVVFEVDTTVASGITSGNTRLDLSGGSTAAAVGTLTSNNTNVSDGDTVTIGSEVYTFKTTLTPTEGQVLIGGSADASLLNLIRAINHSGTSGTDYSNAVADTLVTAATSVTSHAFVVTAKIPGAGGNSIASTETDGSTSRLGWGASTLASGVSPTAGEFTTALNTAINAYNTAGFKWKSSRATANDVLIYTKLAGDNTAACTETLAGSNNAWASATAYGGSQAPDILRTVSVQQRSPNATEDTLEIMHFVFPFTVGACNVTVRTSAGVYEAFDGAVTFSGQIVTVASSGSVDADATDIVTVTASN